tara:strand:- start:1479 stop:1859 length:381 start_codon:yes stop_codon:yes gene_type:complete
MKFLLTLLFLIPSLSWGDVDSFRCKVDSDSTYYKNGSISSSTESNYFDVRINTDNFYVEFDSEYPVGGTRVSFAESKFYWNSLRAVNVNVYTRNQYLWFDGLLFSYTKSDANKVNVIFATCKKIIK